MPELPEVQTVVSDLNKKIKGDKIISFWSDWPSAVKNATLSKFKKEIVGRKILGARRIGKNIFIDLSGEKTIYVHLKMTGHLLIKSKSKNKKSKKPEEYFSERVNQYIHHIWELEGEDGEKKSLEFSDLRKFAKILWVNTSQVENLPEIEALGIDALDPKFTFKMFDEILDKKALRPIGLILMEQSLISGIGNIYRSEILFGAGILPERKAGSLSPFERKRVFSEMKRVLRQAVKLRGTSDSDYRDTDGAPGGFQKVLKVYNREGEKCQKCDTMVVRSKLGQRSVFYCPKCQK